LYSPLGGLGSGLATNLVDGGRELASLMVLCLAEVQVLPIEF
jgi:hypothetical protein